MKIDKRTAIVNAVREYVRKDLDTMISTFEFPITPKNYELIGKITVAYIKDYFKLIPSSNEYIRTKNENDAFYQD